MLLFIILCIILLHPVRIRPFTGQTYILDIPFPRASIVREPDRLLSHVVSPKPVDLPTIFWHK